MAVNPAAAHDNADKELADAVRRLEETAKVYDTKYGEITEIIGQVADNTENVRGFRTETVTELKDDLRNWVEKARKAKEAAQDVEALVERENDVKHLETEQSDLIQEILAGNCQVDKLKHERERVLERMGNVEQDIERLTSRKRQDVPSLKYLLKVMKKISNVVLVESERRNVIRGFVPKPNHQEVSPFSYGDDMEPFERVNLLWDEIYTCSS